MKDDLDRWRRYGRGVTDEGRGAPMPGESIIDARSAIGKPDWEKAGILARTVAPVFLFIPDARPH